MIERLAIRSAADVRLETTVVKVARGVDGVNAVAVVKDGAYDIIQCGRVVVNVPVPEFVASELVDVTDAEKDVFDDLDDCNEQRPPIASI